MCGDHGHTKNNLDLRHIHVNIAVVGEIYKLATYVSVLVTKDGATHVRAILQRS
jgi:hypothetical protein